MEIHKPASQKFNTHTVKSLFMKRYTPPVLATSTGQPTESYPKGKLTRRRVLLHHKSR